MLGYYHTGEHWTHIFYRYIYHFKHYLISGELILFSPLPSIFPRVHSFWFSLCMDQRLWAYRLIFRALFHGTPSFQCPVHSLLSADSSKVIHWLPLLFFYSIWWLDFGLALACGYTEEEANSLRTTRPCKQLILWLLHRRVLPNPVPFLEF